MFQAVYVFGYAKEDFIPFDVLMSDDGLCFSGPVSVNCRDDTVCVLYSSGTTGLPKGVMQTTYNITAAIETLKYEVLTVAD